MATEQQPHVIPAYTLALDTPVQLWIGDHTALLDEVTHELQAFFCKKKGCATCTACTQVSQHQHHAIAWIEPSKGYTMDDIEIIFTTIAFALNDDEQFFFIIQKADFLTPACANSLLKSLEEPPRGYHFILLSERPHQLLPTIKSRSVAYHKKTEATPHEHEQLYDLFVVVNSPPTPSTLQKALDDSNINERESVELVDSLLRHWLAESNHALVKEDIKTYNHAQRIIKLLFSALERPPMPGSSKMLWKQLYLEFYSMSL